VNSALYTGKVRHRRRDHIAHELDVVFAGRWLWSTTRPSLAWFRRADFHGDAARPLKESVLDTVERETGQRPSGRVVLVTLLRYFGISFNPVTFYYCHDADGSLAAIAAEITNTPWLERHTYVMDARGTPEGPLRFHFEKRFHVSPFLDMDHEYDWTFTRLGPRVVVHMQNHRGAAMVFDATMTLERKSITGWSLAATLFRHPFQTAGVLMAIYWQALRLKLKGAPFFVHPRKRLAADVQS
jgi:uncharacterized protein